MADHKVIFQGATPYLRYENAAEAIEWLERVMGFKERARYVDKDEIVRHAQMFVGNTELWLTGVGTGFWETHERGPEQFILVWVDDVDAQYDRVKAAGVDAPPPVDQSVGVRGFSVTDPGGYHWGFRRRLASGYQQTLSLEEGGLREIVKRVTAEVH